MPRTLRPLLAAAALAVALPRTAASLSPFPPPFAAPREAPARAPTDADAGASPGPGGVRQWHGTTTLCFTFDGGVIVAADSRASMGAYVNSRTCRKVFAVSRGVLATMAGGAADCSAWIRRLAREVALEESLSGQPVSVRSAAHSLATSLLNYRGMGLSVGTMVAGWDAVEGGPAAFYVDSEGSCVEGEAFAVGSGSVHAYALLDAERRRDMTLEEAVELAVAAIRHAVYRDGFSGGYINVFHVDERGWRHVQRVDSRKLPVGPKPGPGLGSGGDTGFAAAPPAAAAPALGGDGGPPGGAAAEAPESTT